jgi:hypothetical protein
MGYRNIRLVEVDGIVATMPEHMKRTGKSYGTIYRSLGRKGIKLKSLPRVQTESFQKWKKCRVCRQPSSGRHAHYCNDCRPVPWRAQKSARLCIVCGSTVRTLHAKYCSCHCRELSRPPKRFTQFSLRNLRTKGHVKNAQLSSAPRVRSTASVAHLAKADREGDDFTKNGERKTQ